MVDPVSIAEVPDRAGVRQSATPVGIRLGPLSSIADGAARNFVVQLSGGRFHGFVVRRGTGVFGYVDRCPHAALPLAQSLDACLSADGRFIRCAWHGALFDPASGLCLDGPCVGQRLAAWPVEVVEGEVRTR